MKDTELSGLQGGVCASWSPGDAMGVESSGLVAKAYVRPPSKKNNASYSGFRIELPLYISFRKVCIGATSKI